MLASSLKFEPFADLFWLSPLRMRKLRIYVNGGMRRRSGNISVDLSLFVFYFIIQRNKQI